VSIWIGMNHYMKPKPLTFLSIRMHHLLAPFQLAGVITPAPLSTEQDWYPDFFLGLPGTYTSSSPSGAE